MYSGAYGAWSIADDVRAAGADLNVLIRIGAEPRDGRLARVPGDERRALAILRRVHFLLVELAHVLRMPDLHARRRHARRAPPCTRGSRGAMPKKSVLPSSDHCGVRYDAMRIGCAASKSAVRSMRASRSALRRRRRARRSRCRPCRRTRCRRDCASRRDRRSCCATRARCRCSCRRRATAARRSTRSSTWTPLPVWPSTSIAIASSAPSSLHAISATLPNASSVPAVEIAHDDVGAALALARRSAAARRAIRRRSARSSERRRTWSAHRCADRSRRPCCDSPASRSPRRRRRHRHPAPPRPAPPRPPAVSGVIVKSSQWLLFENCGPFAERTVCSSPPLTAR